MLLFITPDMFPLFVIGGDLGMSRTIVSFPIIIHVVLLNKTNIKIHIDIFIITLENKVIVNSY